MGLDGGTTITRSDVLRGSSWRLANCDTSRSTRGGAISGHGTYQAERADPEQVRRDRLNSCHLSSVDLQPPIVTDHLGNLYAKSAFLEFLLARDHGQFADVETKHRYQNIMRTHPDGLKHIRSLKDLVAVHAQPRADASGNAAKGVVAVHGGKEKRPSGQAGVGQMAHMICPISQLPFLKNRVALLVPCGHVFCHSVIDMVRTSDGVDGTYHCPSCDRCFDVSTEVIEIAADGKHWEDQKERMEKRHVKKRKRKSNMVDRLDAAGGRGKQVRPERPCHQEKS